MISKYLKYISFALLVFVVFSSCDKGTSTETEKQLDKPLPTKVQGTLPANGEPCSDFSPVPNDDSKVSIPFKWNASQHTVNYDLSVLEGAQEVAKTTVGALETSVTLERGKTYSWTVTSKNETGTTVSDTYSFTTPGQAIGNYAPYAAEIALDFDTVNQILNLSWTATDEDGDSLTFDVFILEDEIIVQEELELTINTIEGIAYVNNTSYTVKIITKDVVGNFSVSEKTITSPE